MKLFAMLALVVGCSTLSSNEIEVRSECTPNTVKAYWQVKVIAPQECQMLDLRVHDCFNAATGKTGRLAIAQFRCDK